MTDYQIRLIERIANAARKDFIANKPRDSHGLIPGSYAELAYLTQYDRCAKKTELVAGAQP